MVKRTILLYITIIFCNSIFAQLYNYNFRQLTNEHGLSNSIVNCILQDSKGYVWIGTDDGLNKYDGYEFSVFRKVNGDTTSLCANRIECVFEDSEGLIWIGTNEGLNLYNKDKNNFVRYEENKGGNGLTHRHVKCIIEDRNKIFIGTRGGGLCIYDKATQKFSSHQYIEGDKKSLSSDIIYSFFKDSKNRIWIGTREGGLNIYHRELEKFSHYKFDVPFKKANRIRCILEINNDDYLVGTDAGLFRCSLKNNIFNYTYFKADRNNKESISQGHVRDVFKDTTGIIWVAAQYGLNIFNQENNTFIKIVSESNNLFSIQTNEIWDIDQDNQGNVWFGSYKEGVFLLNLNQKHFYNWNGRSLKNNNTENNSVLSFAENPNGDIWVGIDHKGLFLLDENKNVSTTYVHNANNEKSIASNAVLSIFNKNKDEMLLGFYGGGVELFNKNTGISELFISNGEPIVDWHVWDVIEDAKGRIWTGSLGNGVSCYNTKTKKHKVYWYSADKNITIPSNICRSIIEDSEEEIWIGTSKGLSKYNSTIDGFEYYGFRENKDSKPLEFIVFILFEDSKSRIWLGTEGLGLCLFNKETGLFKSYNQTQGLVNNIVYGILEDNSGDLWISSNKGISKIKINDNDEIVQLYNYNTTNGLRSEQFNRKSCFKSSKGELYFGHNKGFVYFNPDSINVTTNKPKVVLTSFKVLNKEVPILNDLDESPLKKHISQTQQVTLNYNHNVFSIKYAALNLVSAEQNTYAYMLEGFDKDWNYVGNKREVSYTNLDPGKYTFKVKAAGWSGIRKSEPIELDIRILPPWWMAVWFKALFVLFLGSGISFLFLYRLVRLNKQKGLLEQTVSERTEKLKDALRKLQENHEEMQMQTEELEAQKEILTYTNVQLEENKKQLEEHKSNLEQEVKERTKKLEQALKKAEESDKLKASFLANISHEIRTPMNAIVGFANLLKNNNVAKRDRQLYATQISSNTGELVSLLDDILDLSMMEANSVVLNESEFDLNEFINEVYIEGSVKGGLIDLRLSNCIEDLNCTIKTDKKRVKQVLLNLINNALKFTDKGFVELGCDIKSHKLIFYVKDTGIGIPVNERKAIFDRFSRHSDSNSKLFRGAGLGLAISRNIADLLKGKLTVESEMDVGSLFELSFSIDIVTSEIPKKSFVMADYKYNWQNKKVLIAEDEEANYEYLASALKITGIDITWAKDGKEVLKYLEQGKTYDLILMDIKMPELNGFETTLAIRKLNPNQIIIAQTAFAMPEDLQEINKAGFEAYLIKPIIPEDLYSTIIRVCNY